MLRCFHSTNFPSEWGRLLSVLRIPPPVCFHSTNFPSEWGRSRRKPQSRWLLKRFHSTNFPSEWGTSSTSPTVMIKRVSIQLISPASGGYFGRRLPRPEEGFHSTNFPSEWGCHFTMLCQPQAAFPFN